MMRGKFGVAYLKTPIVINKIPALSFIKTSYVYTGDYSWQRASDAFSTFQALDGTTYQLGNTIQNANSHKINAGLDMNMFYKYIGLTAKKQKSYIKNYALFSIDVLLNNSAS